MKIYFTTVFFTIIFILSSTMSKGQTKMDSSITYVHSEKASCTSKMIQSMFSLFGVKKGKNVIKTANQITSTEVVTPVPKSILKNYNVQKSIVYNREVWTIKSNKNPSDKVILYLHGGAYLFTIKKEHWKFVEELLLKTNATIVIPNYPLAPSSNCKNTIDFIGKVYQELLIKHSPKNIILTGDSAGGGLALAFAMTLRNKNHPQPSQIILLSPWLDVTMSNEDILEIDKKDKILGIKSLQIAGKVYAGKLDLTDYRVSPIYGDFSGLGKISIFIGTHDLFLADCRKLKRLTESSNISINYFEYPKMFHDWFILKNMKEAKIAKDQISSLILTRTIHGSSIPKP